MKLLCMDIGNTSITICDYKNEKLGEIAYSITRKQND